MNRFLLKNLLELLNLLIESPVTTKKHTMHVGVVNDWRFVSSMTHDHLHRQALLDQAIKPARVTCSTARSLELGQKLGQQPEVVHLLWGDLLLGLRAALSNHVQETLNVHIGGFQGPGQRRHQRSVGLLIQVFRAS